MTRLTTTPAIFGILVGTLAAALVGCGSNTVAIGLQNVDAAASGGSSGGRNSGGVTSGGGLAIAGTTASGGVNASGGTPATGGSGTGCAPDWTLCCGQCLSPLAGVCQTPCPPAGGTLSTGGVLGTGGIPGSGTGGVLGTGVSNDVCSGRSSMCVPLCQGGVACVCYCPDPSGGAVGSGGSLGTGGTTGAGGATRTGGTTGAGGSKATGGATGSGGSKASGGTTGSGGTGGSTARPAAASRDCSARPVKSATWIQVPATSPTKGEPAWSSPRFAPRSISPCAAATVRPIPATARGLAPALQARTTMARAPRMRVSARRGRSGARDVRLEPVPAVLFALPSLVRLRTQEPRRAAAR